MSVRWRIIESCAPLLAKLPPWWRVRMYARLAGDPFVQGGFSGRKMSRAIAPHGFEMELCLDDWMERHAALTGIFYAIESTAALAGLLRSGDVFVDVGANVGFMTLMAARLVGSGGTMICVEPNAQLFRRLREALERNGIENVTLHQCALGDVEELANLDVNGHHGAGSLRHGGADGTPVEVVRGDRILCSINPAAWCVLKIDVEGYEQRVLSGLADTLLRRRTAFLVEITDEWLTTLGGSAESLFATMRTAGYTAFRPTISRKTGFELIKLDGHNRSAAQYDVIFVRADDDWQGRQC